MRIGPTILVALGLCFVAPLATAQGNLQTHADAPQSLSEWQLFERRGNRIAVTRGVVPYDLNTPLFSDYAHKWRTISIPKGMAIAARVHPCTPRHSHDPCAPEYADEFVFPIGTIISKTFYYPIDEKRASTDERTAVLKRPEQSVGDVLDLTGIRLLETRLLIHTPSGWIALPYVWNDAQTDAALELAGEFFPLELVSDTQREPFTYSVPDVNQCASCHGSGADAVRISPIGVQPRHLDKEFGYARGRENQLSHWRKAGLIRGAAATSTSTRTARWDDPSTSHESRARAYLDVNCAHCHSANGSANTSGLFLDASERDSLRLGVCKIPVATGRGSGVASFDVVPGRPEESILLHRMQSTEPDVAMPEIGRALVHREGVALISEWIASLSGECVETN